MRRIREEAGGAYGADKAYMEEEGAYKERKRGKQLAWLKPVGVALALALILLRPEASVAGGQRAMQTWCAGVAPALFPFLALMPALTCSEACTFYRRVFGAVMQLLDLPGEAAPAVLIGMLAGSPGGAIAVRRVACQAGMKRQDACRLALAVCGMSPAYLVIGVGGGLLGSSALGWQLAGMQCAVQLTLLICLRGFRLAGDEPLEAASGEEMQSSDIRQAVESMLAVCGYMVIFGSVSAAIASFTGNAAGTALLAACDAPGGLAALSQWSSRLRLPVMSAVVGFGGLCIAAQNLDVLRTLGARTGQYLCVRGIAALLMGGLGGIIMRETSITDGIMLNPMPTYAISLLFAASFAVPGIAFLSKKSILNNSKAR